MGQDEHIRIHPAIVGNVHSTAAAFQSRLGKIQSGWSRTGNTLRMDVTIPSGTTTTILFPAAYRKSIAVNGHALAENPAIRNLHLAGASPSCVAAAGTYRFLLQQ
ncbi:MAG: alpha-L-rhamnosidase C-terminal domain-containing protein [Acidobacteriaceae bacterium]